MYHLERYDWNTGITSVIYSNERASFPALYGSRMGTFQVLQLILCDV
jgi:hypothetical protein